MRPRVAGAGGAEEPQAAAAWRATEALGWPAPSPKGAATAELVTGSQS